MKPFGNEDNYTMAQYGNLNGHEGATYQNSIIVLVNFNSSLQFEMRIPMSMSDYQTIVYSQPQCMPWIGQIACGANPKEDPI